VQLVDQETGALKPPAALSDILASVDRKTHFLELVQETPNPIVKIIDKKAIYETKKLQQRFKKSPISTKEIQLTWCMGAADRVHKLRKVREELEKGNRVELVFTSKKKKRVSPHEMETLVQEVLAQMQDVMKEWQPREVKGTLVILHLQGTPSPPS
jgi:translation initiation factor IF-3